MTEKHRVLIITGGGMLSSEQRKTIIAGYQTVADNINAELLVLSGDIDARVQHLCPSPLADFRSVCGDLGAADVSNKRAVKGIYDARLPQYRDGAEGVPLLTEVVDRSDFGRALRWALPMSLLGWGAVGGLVWLVRPLFA